MKFNILSGQVSPCATIATVYLWNFRPFQTKTLCLVTSDPKPPAPHVSLPQPSKPLLFLSLFFLSLNPGPYTNNPTGFALL